MKLTEIQREKIKKYLGIIEGIRIAHVERDDLGKLLEHEIDPLVRMLDGIDEEPDAARVLTFVGCVMLLREAYMGVIVQSFFQERDGIYYGVQSRLTLIQDSLDTLLQGTPSKSV